MILLLETGRRRRVCSKHGHLRRLGRRLSRTVVRLVLPRWAMFHYQMDLSSKTGSAGDLRLLWYCQSCPTGFEQQRS